MTPYQQLIGEMETLRQQAEALRAREVSTVIARMKKAIEIYGITAEELGFPSAPPAPPPLGRLRVRYADGEGNVWGGRGPRPRWLKALIAHGVPLEKLRVDVGGVASSAASARRAVRTPSGASAGGRMAPGAAERQVKFCNGDGKTWSGRGPRPKWLRAALLEGHALSDFAVD